MSRWELPAWVSNPDPTIYEWGVPLFVDFETTTHGNGLAIYKENRIVLACWKLGWDGELRTKWGGEFDMDELVRDIRRADYIVAFNAKFELQWLARCGVDLSDVIVYDPQIAEYVIGGNRWQTGQLSLERVSQRHGLPGKISVVSKMIKAGIPTEDIPAEWLATYCARDVELLPALQRSQLKQLSGTSLLAVVYARCLLTPVLADMETEGLALDPEIVSETMAEVQAEYDVLTRRINEMTGGINVASPIQLAEFLYDKLGFEEIRHRVQGKWVPKRTPTNRRMTGAKEIVNLKATTKDQREFLDTFTRQRNLWSQLTKYLKKFKECCDENDGVLLAKFNQTQTQTHRLSSSGLDYSTQLQNLPRAYKRMFRAKRDGWLVGEADGAQLEFRVAVSLGRDEQGLYDVRHNVDVHRFTADTLSAAGQPTDRQGAKTHTFKPLYGGSSGTEAEQAYYRAFKEKYPGITKTQQEWINEVLISKQLTTPWGLTFYWPDTRMDRSGYITNTTSICNYPVQSFATAEIIPLALVSMWHRLKRERDPGIVLTNTIHDSIVAEVAPDKVEAFNKLARECLIYDATDLIKSLYGIELFCPLGCGVKVGTHWGQGEEVKYEMEEAA